MNQSPNLWRQPNDVTRNGHAPLWLRRALDVVMLAFIFWFAFRHAGFWLRDDLYLYGDHPGQFYRLWQALDVVWPDQGGLIGWSPYWYAGYPELQFYPPGFVILGWGLQVLSLHRFSPVAVYQTLLFVAYVLPGIGFYALLAWGIRDRLAGLVAAWLAMISPALWGGVLGLNYGLVGERIASGLIPLTVLAGLGMMRWHRAWIGAVLTTALLTATLLMHSFHAVAPVLMLGAAALLTQDRWRHMRRLALVVLLTWGLAAFWLAPLLAHPGYTTPIVRATLQQTVGFLRAQWLDLFIVPVIAAGVGFVFHTRARRAATFGVLSGGLAITGFIFLDHRLLMGRLDFYLLDPVRFVASAHVALITAIALGVAELAWLMPRLLRRWRLAPFALILLVAVPYFFYSRINQVFPFDQWMQKWQPAVDKAPLFYTEAAEAYDLGSVWDAIASTEGRVLFTSYYWHLGEIPTTIKAITPIFTGREIIGGTFSHWTPVARYLWTGDVNTKVLQGRVEERDDQALAGVPWDEMTDDFLFNLCRHLNVTLVAATHDDAHARAFLDSAPHFSLAWANDDFFLYNVEGYTPTWADAYHASVEVTRYQRNARGLRVTGAAPDATVHVKVAEYPLWRAYTGNQSLPITRDDLGLIQFTPPLGDSTLELRYRPGLAERLGSGLSLFTIAGLVWLVVRDVRGNR
jgi:hypothetical protein